MLPILAPSGRSRRGSHQVGAAGICEMMYQLKYIKCLQVKTGKAWRLQGTLIHLAMSYYYASRMKAPPDWYLAESLQEALERRGAGFPKDIQRAKEIMLQYAERYADEDWIPVATEQEFATTIGELDPGGEDSSLDSEVITCKPDLIVQIPNPASIRPEYWLVDFKTWRKDWSPKPKGLEKWKDEDKNKFTLDWQVLFYLHIVRKHLPIKGFLIQRMLREPLDGRFDYDRHVLRIPPVAYARAPAEIRRCMRTEREIRQRLASGQRPAQSFWACFQEWGPCDYRPICAAEDPYKVLHEQYAPE